MSEENPSLKGIKSWAEDDRPREKLMKNGPQTLSDAELIGILFGNGTKNQSAVDLARSLLATAQNDVNVLARKSIKDLQKVNGIGPAKAITLMAALELGRRRKEIETPKYTYITSSQSAAEVFSPMMSDLNNEIFVVLFLDTKHKVLHKETISKGGIAATIVDVRIILKNALDHHATRLIIGHNHPSGNTKPSQADIDLTKKIKNAASLMDIQLLDHIIIGQNGFFSFMDEGLMS